MKSARGSFASRYSIAFILCLSCLMILMASALSVSPNSALRSSSIASSARADASAAPSAGEPIARTPVSPLLLPPVAPVITATKTDSPGTPANPGDTITYTVVISNTTGTADALGVMFNDTIDPHTTFVANSILVSPIAVNDSYNTIGNLNISVPAAQGLLANDLNPGGMGTLTITAFDATSANGGTVTVNTTDGSFTYNPAAGFRGPTDTFTYTLGNGTGKTDTATVTITINGMIWFINNDPAAPGSAPGDGRLSNPFRAFGGASSFNTIATDAAGDSIFIYTGTSTYTGGVTLLNNQKLIGQGAGDTLLNISGLSATPPSGANLLPLTGGTNPSIAAAVDNITLGSGNTVRGVTLNVTAAGATALTGTSFGTLTLAETAIGGTNGRALSLTTGTLSGPVSSTAAFTSISSTNSSTTGITLTTVAGNMSSGSTTITNPTGIGISVNTSSAALSFGTTSSTTSGGTGISLLTNTGTITFGALTITPDAGQRGLLATDNSNTITIPSGTITTSTAVALQITRSSGATPLVVSLTSVSANGGTDGIILTNTSGSFTITGDGSNTNNSSGGTIQNSTNNGMTLSNAQNISLTSMNIQSTAHSGIYGSNNVQNFSFVKGTINNSGTASGSGDSNIAFSAGEFSGNTGVNKNISGTLTITGSTLNNAFYSGLDVYQFDGTISNANISNNALTSSTNITLSKSTAILLQCFGSASTVSSISKGTINSNVIANFPSNAGIFVSGGNATSTGAPAGTYGADATTNIISINSNTIAGQASPNQMGTQGIAVTLNGKGSGFFSANSNSITNVKGNGIQISAFGNTTLTMFVIGNTINAHNAAASQGVGAGTGNTFGTSDTPTLNIKVGDGTAGGANHISNTDGNGILIVARSATGHVNARVLTNTVSTPIENPPSGTVYGIRVDAGNLPSVDDAVCLEISGNTTSGNDDGAGTHAPGIGLRKQGTNSTINDFGIVGLPGGSTASPNVENYVNGQNPGSASGSFGVGGTALISAQSGFSSCSEPAGLSFHDVVTASSVSGETTSSQTGAISDSSESAGVFNTLIAHNGKGPGGDDIRKLSQPELTWMAQFAIDRWRQAGITPEELARLQAATFEIANLPEGDIATVSSTHIKIDEAAAGYGWYVDEFPMTDDEFNVPVPGKEFQTTQYSPAFGRMDLLTVVMRDLGTVYLQGKKRTPKQLRPLMEALLSPGTRRLPDPSLVQLPPAQSDVQTSTQAAPSESVASSPRSSSRKGTVHTSSTVSTQATGFPLSLGTIPVGESVTIMFQVTVNALNTLPAGTSQVCNQGTVSGSNFSSVLTDDPSVGGATDSTCTPLNVADLAVTKTDSPDPVIAGNNITYTVNFVNNGPASASTVTVTDAVPANTTFVSAVVTTGAGWGTSAPAVGGTGNIVFSKASVASLETAVFTIVVTVTNTTAHNTVISNSATAASTTSDTQPANNTATATTTVTGLADLAVTKTGSPTPNVSAGSNITYTINFTNNGPGAAVNVAVTDAVPANTTFVSATVTTGSGWSTSAPSVGGTGNVVFSKASVASGETAVFTVVVNVTGATAAGTIITNNGTATADTSDPTPGNNTGTVMTTVIAQADLALTKTGLPTPDVIAGNNITYTIGLTNNGPASANSVSVTDPTPANTTLVSVTTPAGWTRTDVVPVGGTGTITFTKASVANAETATFTIVVKVNSSTANNTTITNTATVNSTTTDPTPGNNSATAMTNAIRRIDLSLTKSDAPDPVIAGSNITYTINFNNAGPSDASTVTVTDTLPAGTSLVSATVTTGSGWSTTTPAGQVVFSKAAVSGGESAVFTIVVSVPSSTASGVTINNSVTAGASETDTNSGNNTATATTTVNTAADLVVLKSDSPDPVTAGGNLTYTISFSNAGPSDAQSVTVSDAVPAGTSFVSAMVTSGTGWAVNPAGPIVFSKGTVLAGESAVFTIVVNVPATTASGTTINNSATANSATTDPVPANNTGMSTTTVQTSADLGVTKSDTPDPVNAGSNITYTINFTNNGPSDAQSVTVTDAIPANTTFVSATVTTGTGWSTNTAGPIVFSKATVAVGESAVFTMVVKVNSNTAGATTITNSATAASTTTDPTPGNNTGTTTTTVQVLSDLSITKSDSPDPVLAGNNLTYTIGLTNNGPSDGSSVSVSDAVPAGTTLVSVTTPAGWTRSDAVPVGGTGTITFTKATVINGETATFVIVVKVNSDFANGGTITNTANLTSTSPDGTAGNNSATSTTTVQTQADLSVTKTDSPDPVTAGTNLTYTINFSNNGPSDAQTVTVTDAVPANTTFVSAVVTTGTGWAVNVSGPIVFSKATVVAGETAVFTMVVHVDANTPSGTTINNSATAATATTDPTPGNNVGMASTTVQTRADLVVTKSDSPDPVFAGANLTYTINFTNNGPSDAQTVTVTDAVPANTTFVSAVVTTGTGWTVTAPAVGGTGNVVFSKATVAAGESAVFTMVVKVNSNVASGATINNSAVGASATTDPTPGNNTGTASTTVAVQADLAVTKSDSPDPVVAGQNLTYTINFVNNGPSNASTVTVSDTVPANTTFVSATVTTGSGWSTSAPAVGGTGTVVFSKATVVAGETAVFTIVVNVNLNTPNNTVITNSATAASPTPDGTPGNNTGTTTTTVIAQADLAVTKIGSPDPACVNGNIVYTINFIDNGPGPGINTTVTDAVPASTTFVSASVTSGTGWGLTAPAVGGTGNVIFSKASVANGETAVFQIVVNVNAGTVHGTVINNSATAASSIPDPNPGNNTGTAMTTVDPIAPTFTNGCPGAVSLAAQASCPFSSAGAVNYATPAASDNCPGVTVACVPPSGSMFPTGTTTVTCTATDAAGNTATCSFPVTVFSLCLQDDSNPGNVVLVNTSTGAYRFCCNGSLVASGTGTLNLRGCTVSINDSSNNRFVLITMDGATMRGTASVKQGGTLLCTIIDRNLANNTCVCQ